jgi:protein phosphatase 1L
MPVNLNFDVNPRYQASNHLNFTIAIPANIQPNAVQKNSTSSTLTSRGQAREGIFDPIKKCFDSITHCFRSIFKWFGFFSRPIGDDTHLVSQESEIQRRLSGQMQHAQLQMSHEPSKGFRYAFAPAGWNAHEERVGNLAVGVCHAQGRRGSMEDEHLAVETRVCIGGRDYPIELFGIFDGHGGPEASRFIRDHLQEELSGALREFNPNGLTEAGTWRALKMTFVRLHRNFKDALPHVANTQGSTATVSMILDNKLWTANVGDSRTVLDNAGTPIQLSEDAKPSDPRYKRNIEKRGGEVAVNRINGVLGVGRAIGDHQLGHAINPRPKITVKPLSEIQPGSHLILCCDGIYDVARTVDIVHNVHAGLSFSPGTLAKNIVYSAYQSGSTDNLSALVVKIR